LTYTKRARLTKAEKEAFERTFEALLKSMTPELRAVYLKKKDEFLLITKVAKRAFTPWWGFVAKQEVVEVMRPKDVF
jgi:hypothetical protein